jgi:hypothetical protein
VHQFLDLRGEDGVRRGEAERLLLGGDGELRCGDERLARAAQEGSGDTGPMSESKRHVG